MQAWAPPPPRGGGGGAGAGRAPPRRPPPPRGPRTPGRAAPPPPPPRVRGDRPAPGLPRLRRDPGRRQRRRARRLLVGARGLGLDGPRRGELARVRRPRRPRPR